MADLLKNYFFKVDSYLSHIVTPKYHYHINQIELFHFLTRPSTHTENESDLSVFPYKRCTLIIQVRNVVFTFAAFNYRIMIMIRHFILCNYLNDRKFMIKSHSSLLLSNNYSVRTWSLLA